MSYLRHTKGLDVQANANVSDECWFATETALAGRMDLRAEDVSSRIVDPLAGAATMSNLPDFNESELVEDVHRLRLMETHRDTPFQDLPDELKAPQPGYPVSQFLLQRPMPVYLSGLDYMADQYSYLDAQRGIRLPQAHHSERLAITPRDLCTFVHSDVDEQYRDAADMLFREGVPLTGATKLPEGAARFVDQGRIHTYALIGAACDDALVYAWSQKWMRRIARPEEVFARAVIDPQSVPSEIVEAVGGSFLSQAFAEGCPAHPSYPAGHAVTALACTSILKALFDEDATIPEVVPNSDGSFATPTGAQLRVGDELDKLIHNIAMSRNAAGVHWAQDFFPSARAAEALAFRTLSQRGRLSSVHFTPFGGS